MTRLVEMWRHWLRPPLGMRGERAAARHLRHAGYRILARNLRTRLGEIDLLAEDSRNNQIVIVEVKTTAGDDPPPETHVDWRKQRKLTALAGQLIRQYRLEHRAVRFDVIAVVWPENHKRPAHLRHHQRAFEAAW